jgi:hypothetical protein
MVIENKKCYILFFTVGYKCNACLITGVVNPMPKLMALAIQFICKSK